MLVETGYWQLALVTEVCVPAAQSASPASHIFSLCVQRVGVGTPHSRHFRLGFESKSGLEVVEVRVAYGMGALRGLRALISE